jgi:hypothetical protein
MKLLPTLLAASTIALAACGGGTAEESEDAFEPMDAGVAPALASAVTTKTAITRGSIPSAPGASQVVFSGHTFEVRGGNGGPGPNAWSTQNVWVDANGWLHLKISQQAGQWSCAEIYSDEALGFGTYQFKIAGHPETFDRNVVLGLFNYPTADIGPDGTNEIDIEFATWGAAQPQRGNWTVWPAVAGTAQTTQPWDVANTAGQSTHRFNWTSKQVAFQSLAGFANHNAGLYADWTFAPVDFASLVPQHAMPLHMNFWLFQGQAPSDAQEAEIVITEFLFKPAKRSR